MQLPNNNNNKLTFVRREGLGDGIYFYSLPQNAGVHCAMAGYAMLCCTVLRCAVLSCPVLCYVI